MPRMVTLHNGARFRVETNLSRCALFVVCKCSGRSIYARGADADRLHTAMHDGWEKFGLNANEDDVWEWVWLNCGFHRLAAEAA